MRETVISIKDITKRFGDFTAVNNMSFDVYKGEIFGFLGANGAGKTTAMRMLCGLSYPTSGSGIVAGYDVMNEGERIKRHIGYMSQRFSLYNDLTVWENMRLFAGIYGLSSKETQERSMDLLNELNFTSSKDALVGSLPLGWKQKLSFVIATIHDPEIIYKAADKGTTIFVTTHYMDEAEYCSRVSIMVDGVIKALDTPMCLKQQFGVQTIDEVFRILARDAKRGGQ